MRREFSRRQSPAAARVSLFQWRGSTLHIEGKALGPCPFSHRLSSCSALHVLQPKHELHRGGTHDRMAPSRRNLRKRRQDKNAFRNSRMRQDQISSPQNKPAIVEYVEIEGARTPPYRPPASCFSLNRVQSRQKRFWRKTSFNCGNGVHEIRLIGPTERFGFEEPRGFDQDDSIAVQFGESAQHSLTRRPPRPRHIGSQRDEYHDGA